MTYTDKFEAPIDELLRSFSLQEKITLFEEVRNGITKRKPQMISTYVYLSEPDTAHIDFFIIYKFYNEGKDTKGIAICSSLVYTNKSLSGYLYAKDHDMLDDYFETLFTNMTLLREGEFTMAIEKILGLSMDKNSPLFWKNQKYISLVVNKIFDASSKISVPPVAPESK
jgi:hypothetical protein